MLFIYCTRRTRDECDVEHGDDVGEEEEVLLRTPNAAKAKFHIEVILLRVLILCYAFYGIEKLGRTKMLVKVPFKGVQVIQLTEKINHCKLLLLYVMYWEIT